MHLSLGKRCKAKTKVVRSSEIETKCNKIHISIGLFVLFMILLQRYCETTRNYLVFVIFISHSFKKTTTTKKQPNIQKHTRTCVGYYTAAAKAEKMCFVIYSHSQHAKRWKRMRWKGSNTFEEKNTEKNKKKTTETFFLHVHGRWNGQESRGNKWNGYVRNVSVPYSIKSFSIILCIMLSMKFCIPIRKRIHKTDTLLMTKKKTTGETKNGKQIRSHPNEAQKLLL